MLFLLALPFIGIAQEYPVSSLTLKNGLKVIVCEKPGNDFAEVQVWYRTGSKDEKDGNRGMAHMFEHMMFRGTQKYPGNFFDVAARKYGWVANAYTSFDRTVYHEYVPLSSLEKAIDIEADRMANLVVTQDILNTEREVVGEEYRNGVNNWYGKMHSDRYPLLYPKGHPYEVDVIGHLNEITAFTTAQCMEFYNNFYSPNNAFLVVVGNVKSAQVFAMAEKYFGPITKQLDLKKKEGLPGVDTSKVRKTDMEIFFPVQIYSYVFPKPACSEKDFFAFSMLLDMLFAEDNSILNNRLVKKEYLAYGMNMMSEVWSLYPSLVTIDIVMDAQPGNSRVKKALREEINKIIADGMPKEAMDKYTRSMAASALLSKYTCQDVADQLGMAQFYFDDHNRAFKLVDEYKKLTPDDLKAAAAKYFSEERMQLINIKPE